MSHSPLFCTMAVMETWILSFQLVLIICLAAENPVWRAICSLTQDSYQNFSKKPVPNKNLSYALHIIKMERKKNATNPYVFFHFEGHLYIIVIPLFLSQQVALMEQNCWGIITVTFKVCEGCRIRLSVSSLKPHYFGRVFISLHSVLRCGLRHYGACLI